MQILKWNLELAYLAKRIARKCDSKFESKFCFNSIRFPRMAVLSDFGRAQYNIRTNQTGINPLNLIETIIQEWPMKYSHGFFRKGVDNM